MWLFDLILIMHKPNMSSTDYRQRFNSLSQTFLSVTFFKHKQHLKSSPQIMANANLSSAAAPSHLWWIESSGNLHEQSDRSRTQRGGERRWRQRSWLTPVWGLLWRSGPLNHMKPYWIFPPFDVIIAPAIITPIIRLSLRLCVTGR